MRISFVLILLLMLSTAGFAAGENSLIRAGNRAYDGQKYGEAFDLYQTAAGEEKQNAKGVYNSGAALYRLKDYAGSARAYTNAAEANEKLRQRAHFNAGDAYYMQGDKDKAVEEFKKAVLLNLKDKDAIHNLQFVLQEKNESRQNEENKDGEQEQQPDDKDENSDNQGNQGKQSQNQSEQDSDSEPDQNQEPRQENQQEQKLSEEEAQSILQMLKDQGNRPAKPLPQNEGAPQGAQIEKDW
jgi:tetratricopeptide (TPR) repeat protein